MLKSMVRLLAELLWDFLGMLFINLLRILMPSAQTS
ncbi:hypothetical protein Goshw_028307 [Gossypium schwendimanii]|uniref:Uncharacterized protein n=1 Tax=Gossypium schwendimanii TaxID=34291 RepID=A0A7J9KV48_GOSSC|nr:hypothetical protein [Gossypium schwendimanii]